MNENSPYRGISLTPSSETKRPEEKQLTHRRPKDRQIQDIVFRTCALDMVTGYGQHSIRTIRALRKIGLNVKIEANWVWDLPVPLPPDIPRDSIRPYHFYDIDTEFCIHTPMEPPRRTRTIRFTMWESGRLPDMAVKHLNDPSVECVIVPCEWNQICFDASGVNKPMAVCPMGIDTKIYYHKPLPDTHKIIFGAGGRLAHGGVRKGVIKVAETFLRAFPGVEDVELQLKVHHDCSVPEHPALLDPRVKLVKETYSERAMADWYHQLHSYVTMATGEGFGFMPLQAMACGRIVIANIAHGHAAYMKPHCVLETGYSLERAPDGLFAYKGYWYEPNEADVIKQMQFVYNQCRAVGVSPTLRRISDQAAYQASKFSWEVYEQRLTQLLQPYVLGGIDCTAMGQANVLR